MVFVTLQAAGQGWKLYMIDPGPAEYLVSFLVTAGIVARLTGLFNKL